MNSEKHVCPLCDYIYDDQKGDTNLGVAPGTPFDELPGDFKHSNCAGSVDVFETCTCVRVESRRQRL